MQKHIVNGCISDPKDEPLYFAQGKLKNGMVKFRCIRGTSSLEGYHRHVRKLFKSCCSSKVAHASLIEFNYRWNIKAAVQNRELSTDVGNFYGLIEKISALILDLFDTKLYPEWINCLEYKDTMERCD